MTLAGWVARRRDHGGVVFIDLRDASGVVAGGAPREARTGPARAAGRVLRPGDRRGAARPAGNENPDLPTGEVEVSRRTPGWRCSPRPTPLPFPVEGGGELNEDARLRYRYLDIRRAEIADALRLRSRGDLPGQ